MMHSEIKRIVLFLVSPQRDFIDKISNDEQKPNALHIGHRAALKLRGNESRGEPDFFVDTAMRFYQLYHKGDERIRVVIDEDWHPRSCPEFAIFGEHCIKGTDGAKLASRLEEQRWEPITHVLRSNSIHVASDKNYSKVMQEVCGNVKPENIRAGVMGVWTSIKVEYLLLNLRYLPPYLSNIAICEPLCADPRKHFHEMSIEKFKVMGYKVIDDIESYCKWMGIS